MAAIEPPRTLYQAVGILFDWLNQIGIKIDRTDIAQKRMLQIKDSEDYKHHYLNGIIGSRFAEQFHESGIAIDTHVAIACDTVAQALSRRIFDSDFVARKFFSKSIQMIYQFGYLPDIREMAQEVLGTPDVKFFRKFIEWSEKNTNQESFNWHNLSGLLQARFFDRVVYNNLVELIRNYGVDKVVNIGKTKPDDLFLLASQMEHDPQAEAFEILIRNRDINELIDFAKACNKIQDSFHSETDQDFAASHGISEEEYKERYQNYSRTKLIEDTLNRFSVIVRDTELMVLSVAGPEISDLASSLEANGYPDVSEEIKNKFLECRDKILKLGARRISDFNSAVKVHDEVARNHREIIYCKKIILNEPIVKFPPPLIPPAPPMITYIDNEDDLMAEGAFMDHCAGSYGTTCSRGESYIYKYENGLSRGTIEISPDGKIEQFFGSRNKDMPQKDWDIVKNWVNSHLGTDPEDEEEPEDLEIEEGEENNRMANILTLSSRQWFTLSDIFKEIA